jgi:poly(A) polymerase
MKLEELLSELGRIAKSQGLSDPFIVGGYPRDRAFGLAPRDVADLDITTGDSGSVALGMAASQAWPSAHYRTYDDWHTSLRFQNIQVDFSNNFNLPGIDDELAGKGIDEPTALQREMFSRDFTANCLLQPLDLSREPLDPTGSGREDIAAKRLRTPVDPGLTIGHDPRRILRALKLSMRFGFELDKDLEEAIGRYRGAVAQLPFSQVKKQINQMLRIDPKKAIELLSKHRLLPMLPLSKLMAMELARHRMVQHLLDGLEDNR